MALLKRQFVDRQLLLVKTARSLKFLEDYVDRQALIWKIFQRHEMTPDDIQDLHFHIDDFKSNIEKEFAFLKEATCKNVENFQSSLNLQQMYSAALHSHVNNIYNKLAEIQQQLSHPNQHMNTGDVIQIEVPDFDPDIDEALPISADQSINHQETQGSVISTQKLAEKTAECRTPASSHQDAQDIDWLDMIPVEIPPQPDQNIEQSIPTLSIRHEMDQVEIPQLEEDPEDEQPQDLQTYLNHHNMYEESQRIRRDYRATLLELDDDRYYPEIERIRPMDHSQHRTIYQQTRPPVLAEPPKNLCKYSVRGEVRRVGKNSTDIDLSEQEQDCCRVAYSRRLIKHNI